MPRDDPTKVPVRKVRRTRRGGAPIVAIAFAAFACTFGCTFGCTAGGADVIPQSARVIVRFEPGTPDPSGRAFLDALAAQARIARLDSIRPMSGDAWVMQVSCAAADNTTTGDACTAAIARLRASRPVVDVEIDHREAHRSTIRGPEPLEQAK